MDDYTKITKTLRRFEQFAELKELELELIDNLGSSLNWVIQFSKNNNIPLENIHHLQYLFKRINILMNEFYPPPDFPTPKDSTEPNDRI